MMANLQTRFNMSHFLAGWDARDAGDFAEAYLQDAFSLLIAGDLEGGSLPTVAAVEITNRWIRNVMRGRRGPGCCPKSSKASNPFFRPSSKRERNGPSNCARIWAKRGRGLFLNKRIAKLVADHPDGALFRSLPGAGDVLAPRLIVAFGTQRDRYQSAYEMQCYSGIAPVTEASGNGQWVHFRAVQQSPHIQSEVSELLHQALELPHQRPFVGWRRSFSW